MIRKRRWLWRGLFALVLLVLVAGAFAFFFPQRCLCVDSGPVKADAIVVLGGGTGSRERPERAAELFRERAAPRIIISGVGDDETNRLFLLKAGVPASAIQLESRSRTTRENARFSIQLLRAEKLQSVILVTSWYHSRRALRCFQHYAPEIQFYSRPSYFAYRRAEWKSRQLIHRIFLEYPKLAGYWLCYGVCPL